MITTDKFTFIHMHKTGGQTLNNVIGECMPDALPVGYHYPYELLPAAKADLPVVGIVRNPWDWYISWYAFNTRPEINNPLFFIISDGFQADYKQTLKNLINLGADTARSANYRNALIDILPDTMDGNNGIGITKDCIRNMASPELGYYSWQFNRMHGDLDRENTLIGRFENLQEEFLTIMESIGVEQSEAMKSVFDQLPRINASKHSHYSAYLDDELRELIAEKEKGLIERYGYRFEAKAGDEKPIQFPSIQIGYKHDGFQKLSGEGNNFLLIDPAVNLDFIKRKLAKIPEKTWHGGDREKVYEVHKATQSLLLIHDSDFRHFKPTYHDLYKDFKKELAPIFDAISKRYNNDGYIVRCLFARLAAGSKIDTHTDGLYSLLKCHRIHIPIITNDQVFFTIGGESKVLGEGEMWEINNSTLHGVDNKSDQDRIHLIIDWVPNSTVRAEDKKPPAPKKEAATSAVPGYNGRSVGRNEPCPCNSGKKFKRCHGAV